MSTFLLAVSGKTEAMQTAEYAHRFGSLGMDNKSFGFLLITD